MVWLQYLQPDLVLGDSIAAIAPALLQKHQLRGLVLDVDETLVPLREREVSPEVAAWVAEIRPLAALWLVSNNLSESRIRGIAESLDLPYILGARKPSRRKLRQAVAGMNLPVAQVAMVGDRLFTDVLAGNRLGMFTILVEPMVGAAIANRSYPIRNLEVWLSQRLGVQLARQQQNVTNSHKA